LALDAVAAAADRAPVVAVVALVAEVPSLVVAEAVVPVVTLAADVVEEADAAEADEDAALPVAERAVVVVVAPVPDDAGANVAVLVAVDAPDAVVAFAVLPAPLQEVRSKTRQSSTLGPSGRGDVPRRCPTMAHFSHSITPASEGSPKEQWQL
jgi:hypothetical protein